jgi:hypothetical protein
MTGIEMLEFWQAVGLFRRIGRAAATFSLVVLSFGGGGRRLLSFRVERPCVERTSDAPGEAIFALTANLM